MMNDYVIALSNWLKNKLGNTHHHESADAANPVLSQALFFIKNLVFIDRCQSLLH